MEVLSSIPAESYMYGAHQAFHPSEVGKSVPASAGGEKPFVLPWGGECTAAVVFAPVNP